MEEDIKNKTRIVTKRRVLKDGTVKEYKSTITYKVKGAINPDGSVTKFSEDQIKDMKWLKSLGVTTTKIAEKYETTHNTVRKIVKG